MENLANTGGLRAQRSWCMMMMMILHWFLLISDAHHPVKAIESQGSRVVHMNSGKRPHEVEVFDVDDLINEVVAHDSKRPKLGDELGMTT